MGRKHCGKRRNCSLRAISPFPTVFSKDLHCRHVKIQGLFGKGLSVIMNIIEYKYHIILSHQDPEDRIFNRVISDISVVLRETTVTISDSIEPDSAVESEIVSVVVFLNNTEITEITRFK